MASGLKTADTPVLHRLESWKHIASYLNCNERTAKRWEATRRLPVRRLPGARGGVFALVSEIEAWQMGVPVDAATPSPQASLEENGEAVANHLTQVAESSAFLEPDKLEPQTVDNGRQLFDIAEAERQKAETQKVEGQEAFAASPIAIPPFAARSGFRWQILMGAALLLLVATSLSRLHQSALANRREADVHVPPPEARELYLKARFFWNKRTPQDLKFALATFQKAIAIDPQYADAYAGIAECYGLSTEYAALPASEAYPRMLDAAQKAIALNPNLPSAHRALGFALFYWNWDRAGAEREFQRAIELNPSDATTHHWYANVLQQSQQFPAAVREMDKARELDPAAPSILADHGLALSVAGKLHEGREDWLQLEKTDPAYLPPHWYMAESYLNTRDTANYLAELKAIAAISGAPDDISRSSVAQTAFAGGRDKAVFNALADLSVQQYNQQRISAMRVAFALAGARRNDEAMQYIQRAYRDRDPIFLILADRRHFPALADQPAYRLLEEKSRLPYPQAAAQLADAATPDLRD